MLNLEELSDEELRQLEQQFRRLRAEALERRANPKLMVRRNPTKES
jgi:hypothetical protein